MSIGLLYWLLALLCCTYAIVFGGRDGRWAGFLFLIASGLTIPAGRLGKAWGETELLVLGVDLSFLVGLYVLMLTSRRYWPIWMVGLHLVAVVTHLSTMLTPDFTPRIYRAMESFWAIPVLLSLLIGVELDRRAAWRFRTAAPRAGEGRGHEP
ncbi:MAG: hypothetical protein QOC65_50 [Sphingomonadales bacterium]|nr:hypothetical protein [Sphingomonadales bacterium]